jgi:predicted nucleotidyltransferase
MLPTMKSQPNHKPDVTEIKKEISERLQPLLLEKIVLFGSLARGDFSEDSDIDLYVVTKDEFIPSSWSEKNRIYLNVSSRLRDLRKTYPIDLIVHTKKMYEKFVELKSSMAKEILQHGVLINA